VADVPSGLSLTPPRETKKKTTDVSEQPAASILTVTELVDVAVTLYTLILEVLGSSFELDTEYPEIIRVFFSSHPRDIPVFEMERGTN
jgi:hypothetical protein